jgi:hypothetical protein
MSIGGNSISAFKPKIMQYKSNGGGRDSYVTSNNGGHSNISMKYGHDSYNWHGFP